MSNPIRVLILEDRAADAELMLHELRQAGFDPVWQRVDIEVVYQAALETKPDLILADWSLPQFSGLRALQLMNERGLDIPFIIVSGSIGEEVAVEAMRQGAADYLLKDRLPRLGQAVRHALEDKQQRAERKRAEEALRESESKFRGIVEQSSDGIILADEQGIIIEWNKSQEQITDIRRGDALGKPVWDILYQTLSEELKTAITYERFRTNSQSLLRIGEAPWLNQLQESVIQHSDGTCRSVQAVMFPIRTVNGLMVASIVRDITERKQAEDALQESEKKYRMLFDEAPVGIAISTLEGKIIDLNKAQAEMIGRTIEELREKGVNEYYIDSDKRIEMIEVLKSNGKVRDFEMKLRRSDGSIITELLNLDNVQIGTINYIFTIGRDITERKRAEERIFRQLEHLTALNAIDRIIAGNFDLKLGLSEILIHVTKELGIDAADILIINPDSKMLEFGAERGFRTQAIRKARVRLGESFAGRVALERQLVQISNIRDEPDNLFLSTLLKVEDFVCYYGVPLIIKGQIKGVLEVFHRTALEPDAEWFDFLNSLAGQAAIAIDNATLYKNLQHSNIELTLAYEATIEGWSRALDLRDKETEGHTQRVTRISMDLAQAMGVGDAELANIRRGALLHDIGKMGVPDHILLKPDKLTDEEWVIMRRHPTFAHELLLPIIYLKSALNIPYCHHEKWDGTGYPRGLKGEQIPLSARIFSVVDVWDALTSDRPYRPGWTKEKAREHILASSGTHFDPQVVDVFMQMPN